MTRIDGHAVAVSAGVDKKIRMWNIYPSAGFSGEIGSRWNRKGNCIRALSITSVNGREVAVTVAEDGTIQVWDLRNRKLVDGPYNLNRGLHAIAISDSTGSRSPFAVVGGADSSITAWDLNSGRTFQRELLGHTNSVEALAIGQLSGSPIVASGSSDTTIGLWDLLTATHLKSLTGHSDWVQAIALTHVASELIVVSGSADATIRIWNVAHRLATPSPTADR
jgi:WD40 repeat protein